MLEDCVKQEFACEAKLHTWLIINCAAQMNTISCLREYCEPANAKNRPTERTIRTIMIIRSEVVVEIH